MSIDDIIGYDKDGKLVKHLVDVFWKKVYNKETFRTVINYPVQLLIPFPKYTSIYRDSPYMLKPKNKPYDNHQGKYYIKED